MLFFSTLLILCALPLLVLCVEDYYKVFQDRHCPRTKLADSCESSSWA